MSKGASGITYIGSFPPPFGGVTVKNALLVKYLSERMSIDKIDLSLVKRFSPEECGRLLGSLFSPKGALAIGVSLDWCKRLVGLLYRFNRAKLGRSVIFMMGGTIPQSASFAQELNSAKRVYVETKTMKAQLLAVGVENAAIYPNCRERHDTTPAIRGSRNGLSAVFFSCISKVKGADIVIEAARSLPGIDFHFYGRIDEGYAAEFAESCAQLPNVRYHGVYDSANGDVVGEISRYDVHLFPTVYPNEGVPGVIVETKMAGVPTIATDVCFNADLVEDGVDGFLIRPHGSDELVDRLLVLNGSPETLDALRGSALRSAEEYCIDRYLDGILEELASPSSPEV